MTNIKLNNLFTTQGKTILFHYKIKFQGVNTNLKHLNNITLATATQHGFNRFN